MSLKKFKKFDDNFNSIIKSLRPIKDKFSKQSIKHDNYFKKTSLEVLEKNLHGRKKPPENFYNSKLYKNIDYMYNISNDCYDYIENLKGLKNIPIKINKKGFNFIKNLYNPEFETKPEDNYFNNDNKQNYIYNLKKYNQKKKNFKFAVYALDPGYYHPNYNFVKKRIPSIDFSKSTNSHDKNEFAKIFENYINNDLIENNEIINDKILDKTNVIIEEEKKQLEDINHIPHIYQTIDQSEQINVINNEENYENNKLIKNKSRNYPRNLDNISQTVLPSIKKGEFKLNKKFSLPKILHKSNSQLTISTPVMISFKKMMGRNVIKKEKNEIEKSDIEYKPNYSSTLPHVRSFQFKSRGSRQNYKKYIVGKILRSYSFNSYGYYVMDIKKKNKNNRYKII